MKINTIQKIEWVYHILRVSIFTASCAKLLPSPRRKSL